ncbi:hypothetical protein [Burkholderia pseudomallei]|uniref:hypothetical protein n=1 Tax=Burkholderia pseudomallei TaxID=28450 RepID=UPI003F656BAD
MEVHVKTNQYAIGLPGQHRLHTQFINTCTAFMGIDPVTGVTFLCHLNSPVSADSLSMLVEELKTHVDDVARFQLYTLGGMSPRWLWLLSAIVALAGWAIFHKYDPLFSVVGAVACGLAVRGAFSWTRRALKGRLKALNVFANAPISLGFSSAARGFGKTAVILDEFSRDYGPCKHSYFSDPADEKFEATPARRFSRAWWRLNWVEMTRADGSALPGTRGSNKVAAHAREGAAGRRSTV